jgi:hypothetical protein
MSEYDEQLAAWKAKHGLGEKAEHNEHELRMAAEEQASKGRSWCSGCDKEMPIREMKLITRGIDRYRQCDEGGTDYIAPANRVRMCPECFKENYETND